MKCNAWLLSALASLTALSVLAQTPNPVPPAPAPTPPPAVSAVPDTETPAAAKPAKKPKAKAKAKKAKEPKESSVKGSIVLNPPVTATVKCDVLDVRGQGSFAGEVIGRLKKGDSVTVVEEVTLGHLRPNEPEQWSRIVMPASTPVWVDADFIDPTTKAVRANRINVRGGPGENYSIVGKLDKGTDVKEISKKDNWLQIETPTNTFAFVASEYLEKSAAETPAPVVAVAAPVPAPPPAAAPPVVVNVPAETPPPVAAAPAQGITAPAPTAASQAQELAESHQPAPAPAPAPVAAQPEVASPATARIVTREGFVHRSYNIQTPEAFELHDIKTGELIEYLQPGPGKKFKAYVGTRVRIVGSESLDPRWPRTPILQIQTIDLMP